MQLEVGSLLNDRYSIIAMLGEGGMGTVYSARDCQLDRLVAIKILRNPNNRTVDRFERECRSLAAVKSPGLPAIYTWGITSDKSLYIVMELIDGETLDKTLDQNHVLDAELVRSIGIQVCAILIEIHEQGIVHRDIKPENLMLCRTAGSLDIKLLDLGLAHLLMEDQSLTKTNEILGSVAYMSPEHVTPKTLDARSDIFSLGCVMYRALAGEPPFASQSAFASLMRAQTNERTDLPETVPPYLRAIVDKCLEANPEHRFQNAERLRLALTNKTISESREIPRKGTRKKRPPHVAVLCALVAVLTTGFMLYKFGPGSNQHTMSVEKLADQMRSASQEHNAGLQQKLIDYVDQNPEYVCSRANAKTLTPLLIQIAAQQLLARRRSTGDRAFALAIKSLDWQQTSYNERAAFWLIMVNTYLAAGYGDASVLALANQAVGITVEAKNVMMEKRARLTLALLYVRNNNFDKAVAAFDAAMKCPDESVPANQFETQAQVAINYAQLLQTRKTMVAKQIQLLEYAAQKLTALAKSSTDVAIGLPCGFCQAARAIALADRTPQLAKTMADTMTLLAARSGFAADAAFCTVCAGEYVYPLDQVKAKKLLEEALTTAEAKARWDYYQVAVYSLNDHGFLPEEKKRLALLENVYRRIKPKLLSDKNHDLLMRITFQPGYESNLQGDYKKALAYYRVALEQAALFKLSPRTDPEGHRTKVMILTTMQHYFLKHGQADLAKECQTLVQANH